MVFKKKKEKLPQNTTVVMNPNRGGNSPYSLKEEESNEESYDLQGDELERLQKQLKAVEEEKQKLIASKEKRERREAEEVEEEEEEEEEKSEEEVPQEPEVKKIPKQAYIIQASLVEGNKGIFHYVVETTYPLAVGPCKLEQ